MQGRDATALFESYHFFTDRHHNLLVRIQCFRGGGMWSYSYSWIGPSIDRSSDSNSTATTKPYTMKPQTQAKMKPVDVPPEVLKKYCMDISQVRLQ